MLYLEQIWPEGPGIVTLTGKNCTILSQVNNTSEWPQNVSSTLTNIENLANPNDTAANKTVSSNMTAADGVAPPPVSSNRVVMQPESGGGTNLIQRVGLMKQYKCPVRPAYEAYSSVQNNCPYLRADLI